MYENEIYSNSDSGNYTTYQTSGSSAMDGSGTGNAGAGRQGKKKKGAFRKFLLSMGLGITFGAFAGAGFYAVRLGTEKLIPDQVQEAVSEAGQKNGNTSGAQMSNISQVTYVSDDVSAVVEKVMPAMVSIVNNQTRTTSFFGYEFTENRPGAGSGIIVAENDTELLIVSNNHVVANSDSLEVTFIDGSTAAARDLTRRWTWQ